MTLEDPHETRELEDELSVHSPKQHNVRAWNAFISIICLASVTLSLYEEYSMFSKEPDTNKLHLTAFKVFSIMVLCIQASACLWFHQVCYAAYAGHVRYCPKAENWLQLLPEFSTNSTGITDMEFYATSLYWSTITLCSIGYTYYDVSHNAYGDIHATNLEEATVASFVMVLGLLSFGISMSNMSSVITNMVTQRGRFYHRVDAILNYMRQMGLSEEIQEWVHKHYYNLWFHQKGRNIAGFMDDLPFVLHSDVSSCCYKTVIENAKLFRKTEDGFKRALSLKLKTCTYSPGQILVKTGEIHQKMYYIQQGLVQVIGKNPGNEIAKLLPGSLFGEVHLLYEIPRNVTMCALTKCEIVILERKDLLLLFADYPEELFSEGWGTIYLAVNVLIYIVAAFDILMNLRTGVLMEDGYGDIVPGSLVEQCLAAVVGVVALLVFNYIISQLSATLSGENAKRVAFQNLFSEMRHFMKRHDLTVFLQNRVMNYMNLLWSKYQTLMGRITYFFLSSCPSTFLMRKAILPSSAFYVRWEFFRSMLAVTVSIITSLLIAFLHFRMDLWIVCYILGLFCWVDIYLRMHVAFYEDNDLKVDTLETAHHYVKTGFLVDFITCFPWELVGWIVISPFSENGFYANNEALHHYAYLRIPHVFQLYRIPFAFSFLQADIAAERNIITVLMMLLYSAFSVHFATCIAFASACPAADLHGNISDYFLPVIKHNCTPLSWVVHVDKSFDVDFGTVTFQQLYLTSMYFATTTICAVGFGDIYPSLMAMKIGMTFIMIAAMLFTGWLSGTVTAMLANRDAMRAAYTEKTESMKLFLKVFGLNLQIKKTLESETRPLSPVAITKAGKLSGPFFETMLTKECLEELKTDGCFIRLLARRISQSLFRADDLIYKKNDYGSEMYFIHKGEVEVLSKDNTAVLFKLKAGQYFGEKSLLLGEPRAATVRAATNCELYVLSKKSLDEALMYYPSIFKQMQSAADEMKYQLHKGDLQINTFKKPGSAGETFLRTGSVKLYREHMAEEEHRAELRSRSLGTRLCTSISSVLIQFFLKIFNKMRRIHNKTIDPESNFRVIYQYTSCLLITIFFWAITFMPTVFDVEYYLFILTMGVELLQIIEIFLKFRICYYDDSGTFISEYRSTSRNYMKRKVGFVFDMVFSFPYGLIIFHQMKRDPTKFLPMLIYVRIAHLPRIISLILFMWKEEQSLTNNLLLIRLIKYFVHSFLFIHCAAVLCVSFVESHGIMSWVAETEFYDFTEMYRYATYWILQIYTTTGYGDITASNFGEMIACVMIMILSKSQVIYKMGLLVAAQTNKMTLQEAFEEKLQTIQEHMMHEKVPSTLQNRVTQFYSYQWNRTKGTCAEVLFKGVPRCLKMDIVSRICMQHLKKHHLFSHLREAVMRELSTRILFRCFPVGEFIYRKGDIATGMYLILIGKVNLCLDKRGRNVFQRLSAGAAFGDHFLLERKHSDTAIATNYVDIAMLSKDALEDVALLCPSVGKLLKRASEMPQL
ncbi:hypothetical protein cypCar_00012348 [Cyprinus carpio]|nr:hypothetical protein cypCar_00012348 [Cyprinus carpio]